MGGWGHSLPERERRCHRDSEDDDATNIPVDESGNIEQPKISLASDSACTCRPWLPCFSAERHSGVKTLDTRLRRRSGNTNHSERIPK